MSKRKPIGIIPLTETEQKRTLTPQEKHNEVQHLIPFQCEGCLKYVKLENVGKRIGQGWFLKCQNVLQSQKATMALTVHRALEHEKLTTKEAKTIYALIEKATSETAPEVQQEIFRIINKEV